MVRDKKGKYHQKVIGTGLSKEVWNEDTEDYESSFKAYVRQQKENAEDKSMFIFEMEGKDDELVMNRNNSKVMWTLAICALFGGLIAGLMIRFLIRKYFPEEEQSKPIIPASVRSSIAPASVRSSAVKSFRTSEVKVKRGDTERESFPGRSTKASFELS